MRHWFLCARYLLPLLVVTALPVLLTPDLWTEVWTGVRSHAWDGSGHEALARIYSEQTFPDTFGWTHSFYGGIPHPNFYPPLLYWLAAALDRLPFATPAAALKLVVVIPSLLLPSATWLLSYKLSGRDRKLAFAAALATTPLLAHSGFFIVSGPLGITYMSTFLIGLYSHPLGYLLLILWYVVYSEHRQPMWRFFLATLLLALALLGSFFSASIAALFVIATLAHDVLRLRQAAGASAAFREALRTLSAHLVSPLVAGLLTLFWLAPVFAAREYMMTRPTQVPISDLLTPASSVWYLLAGIGIILRLRHQRDDLMVPYLATCLAVVGAILFAGTLAPKWFPLHPSRLIATLNFLLAVPIGVTLTALVTRVSSPFRFSVAGKRSIGGNHSGRQTTSTAGDPLRIAATALALLVGALVILWSITPPSFKLAFYPTTDREAIDPLLAFAREHRDGRYLVEVTPFADTATGHEGRAINNYLGGQGNEVLSLFFREASPNVLFFSPLVNVFSTQPDPYGISSVLADDLSFNKQMIPDQLRRLRFMGVRYLVANSRAVKERLTGQPQVAAQHDFGAWTVYELGGEPVPRARALTYKPALVVTDLNVKGRRTNAYDFTRFGEEQIMSNWYDVPLARSPESRLDRLNVADGFGALVIDACEYDDERAAFERLREISRRHQIVLLGSDNPLIDRVRRARIEFARLEIIERKAEAPGEWIEPGPPTRDYEASQGRRIWRSLQRILDAGKEAVIEPKAMNGQVGVNSIDVAPSTPLAEAVPVLINTTFHPNWRRTDGEQLYPVTPFWMLTFVREPVHLTFARRSSDWAGLAASAMTLLLLCGVLIWGYGGEAARRMWRRESRRSSPDRVRHAARAASSIT